MLSLCSTVHEAGPLNERINFKKTTALSLIYRSSRRSLKKRRKRKKKQGSFSALYSGFQSGKLSYSGFQSGKLSYSGFQSGKLSYSGFQSARLLGHSTKTALLKIGNDFLLFFCGGNVSLLHLWDLPAAFDTIDIVHITP